MFSGSLETEFFRAFTCIYSRLHASEAITVGLLKKYCLSFMLCATEAVMLSASNMRHLDNCINKAVHRILDVGTSDNLSRGRKAFV